MSITRQLFRGGALAALLVSTAARSQAQEAAEPAPAPPPAAAPQRSMADLEKLVAPIALYPDPLLATMFTAAVYPLEIVQAARFVADTNNLAKLDEQPWDANVKAVARVPDVIKKMNEDIAWTMELGEAFLAQDKEIMDAVQNLRGKAQKAGTLQTTPQQVVTVTNIVAEQTIEQQVVVVTNTVVQIEPADPQVIYVPSYNPTTVYYPPPSYVYNPVAPLVTFTAGMAMGAIIANGCNWYGGGCYHSNVDIDIDKNVNRDTNRNTNRNTSGTGGRASATGAGGQQKWQPDQSRLSKSGAPSTANASRNTSARGYGSGGATPSTGAAGTRPATGAASTRPSAGTAGAKPSTGAGAATRPSAAPSTSRSTASSASPSPARASASASKPASASSSAFGGVSSGAGDRASSSRGSASRSSGASSAARSGGGSRGGGRR